jgi:hypothetical protein
MRYLILVCFVIIGLLLGACQVLNAPNMPATLNAQNTAYAAEATAIPLALGQTSVAIARTAVAAETHVAEINSINRQLIATANVIAPSTLSPQIAVAPVDSGNGQTANSAVTTFADSAVTSRKRDSDGCADGSGAQFPVDTSIIYAITRATTINSGDIVSVEWKYQGQVVSSGSYTASQDETNFCIWFPLDPANVPFTPGSWSVQFSLNRNVVEPTLFFNIGEPPTPTQ